MANTFAQVGISSTSITPDVSSILELRSTTQGFLPPRMTTTQRDAITSPATALLIYNTTTNQLNYYSGSAWQVAAGGGQAQLNGTGFVKASGTTISYDNSSYITNANVVFNNQANSYTAGMKQIFQSSATTAGFNFGGVIADPSSLISGDYWFRSDLGKFFYRDGTTSRPLVAEALAQTLTNKDLTSVTNTFPTFNQNTTGNASTVTTNANLTGDVTSVGNATTIGANKVTNTMLSQMATNTIKGNNTVSTANASDLTVAQVNAILPVFTSSLNGLVPASSGGTTNYLRADGTFQFPAGGIASMTAVSAAINTTETKLLSAVIPANFMQAVTTFRITVFGTCTSSAANTSNIRVRLGTAGTNADVVVAIVSPVAASSGTNIPFSATLMVTIRTSGTSGTAGGGGMLTSNSSTGISSFGVAVGTPISGIAVNTTVSNTIQVTYSSPATTTTSTFQIATIEVVDK